MTITLHSFQFDSIFRSRLVTAVKRFARPHFFLAFQIVSAFDVHLQNRTQTVPDSAMVPAILQGKTEAFRSGCRLTASDKPAFMPRQASASGSDLAGLALAVLCCSPSTYRWTSPSRFQALNVWRSGVHSLDVVVLSDQPQTNTLLVLWVHNGVSTLREWGAIRPDQTKNRSRVFDHGLQAPTPRG